MWSPNQPLMLLSQKKIIPHPLKTMILNYVAKNNNNNQLKVSMLFEIIYISIYGFIHSIF